MTPEELKQRLGPTVFDEAPCLVAVVDPQHRVVLSNAVFQETFGREGAPLCHRLFKNSDGPCEPCVLADVLGDGQQHSSVEEGLSRSNAVVRYQVRALPLPDGAGPVDYVLLLSTDVSRVVELEEALRQAERLANVGLSAAGLAHTIKGLLSGLQGGAYLVSTGLDRGDNGRVQSGWEMVQGYVDQVGRLIGNLLDYAKPRRVEPEQTDLGDLIDDVIGLYREKARTSGIRIDADIDPDVPPLLLNRAAMHATLANLIANALDACMWDPDIDKPHHILLSAGLRDAGGVVLTVEDDGPGIAGEHQPKILRSLFTTKGMRGTGLGLLLSKQVVLDHGGTIDFESCPGQGTTFRIELPAAADGGP